MNLYLPQFDIGDLPCELFWLAGLTRNERNAWFVNAVLRDHLNQFHMKSLPMGQLPMLTLGQVFLKGNQLPLSTIGITGSVRVNNVSDYDEITSAELPAAIYSFGNAMTGTQRLFRYEADGLEIFIPTIELIRYLFMHNRTLANALMRPSALMTLFSPETPGYYSELNLKFTKEMPKSTLSNSIAQEFAWLAIDPDARKSWDSVYEISKDKKYLSFAPPAIKDSEWRFRGIRSGNQWLVLELLHLSGRTQPCDKLLYSHPAFKKSIVVPGGEVGIDKTGNNDEDQSKEPPEKTIYDYQLDEGQSGCKPSENPESLKPVSKLSSFDKDIQIKKLYVGIEREATEIDKRLNPKEPLQVKKTVWVSASEFSTVAELPAIEFNILLQASQDHIGDLDVSAEVMRQLSHYLPDSQIAMSLCYLKNGRAFSMANRYPRVALISHISLRNEPPIVLIDVEKTGSVALSMLLLRFRYALPLTELEITLQSILDGLVDSCGHWDRTIEDVLDEKCIIDRLPRIFSPRDKAGNPGQTNLWAAKLAHKINSSMTAIGQ